MPRRLLALMLLIISLAPATGAAAPSPATLRPEAPVYLALGDSLAFGTGASDPERTGYVPLVHGALQRELGCHDAAEAPCPDLQLLNLAENGATTASLLETQLPVAMAVLEERNGDANPANDVVAITIDIGGNDAVGGVFEACAEAVTVRCGPAVQETLEIIDRNLTRILFGLREAAGPETPIAVMTYFNSLVGCDFSDAAENAELVLAGVPGVTPGLNGIIEQAADRADALVAETFGLLEVDDLVGGVDCLHANDAGYVKIATAFVGVLTGSASGTD